MTTSKDMEFFLINCAAEKSKRRCSKIDNRNDDFNSLYYQELIV